MYLVLDIIYVYMHKKVQKPNQQQVIHVYASYTQTHTHSLPTN